MINILQAGRFFAALAIVILHTSVMTAGLVGELPRYLQATMAFGYLGVDFFFVLSGFIIHYTMTRMPRSAGQFAYERLTRIMLPYWPAGIAVALAYATVPSLSQGDRTWGWWSTLTLFPTSLEPALVVAWTLQHELVFYLLYAALYFLGTVALGLSLWAAAIVAAFFAGQSDLPLFRILLAPINIEFVMGAAAAAVFIRGWRPYPFLSFALAAACLASFWAVGGNRQVSWLVGSAIAALLPWLCHSERAERFEVPAWLIWAGTASYAIYLIHTPVLSVTLRVLGYVGTSWLPALVVAGSICVAAGAVYHVAWERPVMQAVRRSSAPKGRTPDPPATG